MIQFDEHIFKMGWNHQLENDHSGLMIQQIYKSEL